MKRLMALMALTIFCAGCLLPGCALHTNYDVKTQRTHVEGRVGLVDATVIDFKADLPAEIDIVVGSDLALYVIKATIGGGIVDAVIDGVAAFHNWLWGTG